MALSEILDTLAANPELLAIVLAIIYNVAGYVMSMLKIKALEPYQKTELVKTLVLFETMFVILSRLGGLDVKYTTVFALAAAIIISLKDKISALAKATAQNSS